MYQDKDFEQEIDKFHEHERSSEELYKAFKEVFDIAVKKAKNSITMTGGLRDLSEAAKSLSSVRGDSISSTAHAFASKMKVAELAIKKEQVTKGESDVNSAAMLMRQLTETIHRQNIGRTTNSNADYEDTRGEDLLKQRVSKDISNGSLKLNNNEKSMKYDFIGVTYRYDSINDCMVVLDKFGNKISNYPEERIPEEFRFKRIQDGVPIDTCGREIKPYME